MKALLKNFEWVEIDTKVVFDNQYNTNKERIFDSQIIRIVDDIRLLNPGFCHCGYCGKQFLTLEDYNKHLQEENAKARKTCKGCYWHSVHRESTSETKHLYTVYRPDGSEQQVCNVVTNISYTDKGCRHIPEYEVCEHEEHSKYKAHTFEHSYFVKHPYGNLFDCITPIQSKNVYGSWYVDVYPETLSYKLYNSREVYSGVAVLNDRDTVQSFNIETENKTLKTAQDYARSVIEHYAKEITNFNKRVTDDRYWSNPDGSQMKSAIINGVEHFRPAPIETKWNYKE